MQEIINNRLETIDKSTLIKVGGEGMVFKFQGYALKIYDPDPRIDRERDKKLRYFFSKNFQLDRNILVPLQPVYDPRSKLINGFLMNLLPVDVCSIDFLTKKDYRQKNGITTKTVADLLLKVFRLNDSLHGQNILQVDGNDKNYQINPYNVWLIDFDTCLLPGHPQNYIGFTIDFIDPLIYDSRKNQLIKVGPENDTYSCLIHLFRSLTLAHPFKGTCPGYNTVIERAQACIPVWNPRVIYPSNALPIDIISDDIMKVFDNWFVQQKRTGFSIADLKKYAEDLIECKKCGLWFPQSRKKCPGCKFEAVLAKKLSQTVNGCQCEILLETTGAVMILKIEGDKIKTIIDEKGKVLFLSKSILGPWQKNKLFSSRPGAEYKITQDKVVVHTKSDSQRLLIYDFGTKKKHQLTTELFSGYQAVFDTSTQYTYRIAHGTILRGEFKFGTVVEHEIVTLPKNQAWFKAYTRQTQNKTEEVLFGFYRIFRDTNWFLTVNNETKKVNLPALDKKETLSEIEVLFSPTAILLLRKTRKQGREIIRVDLVHYDGYVSASKKSEIVAGSLYENIFGKISVGNFVFHPTNNGIVREDIMTGQKTTFSDTKNFVQGGDYLFLYDKGVLVVKSNKLLYLTLTN